MRMDSTQDGLPGFWELVWLKSRAMLSRGFLDAFRVSVWTAIFVGAVWIPLAWVLFAKAGWRVPSWAPLWFIGTQATCYMVVGFTRGACAAIHEWRTSQNGAEGLRWQIVLNWKDFCNENVVIVMWRAVRWMKRTAKTRSDALDTIAMMGK